MAKDPALLFYTADFLTGTLTMTDDQVGKYIRLLCLQHQKGKLSKKDMQSICRAYDEDVYGKFKQDKNGDYYNVRLREEAERRRRYTESRRKNAKKAYAKHMDEHMETETVTITENKIYLENINAVKFEMQNSDEWHNAIMRRYPGISKRDVLDGIITFCADLEAKFDVNKDYKEIQRHFVNWLGKHLPDKSQQAQAAKNITYRTPIDKAQQKCLMEGGFNVKYEEDKTHEMDEYLNKHYKP